MSDREYDPIFLRSIFEATRVIRKPITGIVAGYHRIPYILVGPDEARKGRAVEVRGQIRVSPRLIISPSQLRQTYGEVFGESEMMDKALVGRVFSFLYRGGRQMQLEHDELTIRPIDADPEARVERALDELAMGEILDTGLILSPNVRFYPVSIDRFLQEILDRELQT
jgi:hypothetical protein